MALKGMKVLELAGLAPSPMCGMILSDFGAKVIRVDRVGGGLNYDVTARGKRSIAVNMKKPDGLNILTKLSRESDVLIDPFRPGVMEKSGLGPEQLMEINPQLVYARLTGFGQTGPFRDMAGHDINYLALSGVLNFLGRKNENPLPPVNLMADFAGGSFVCALGIMAALLERTSSGKGQIVDNSMVEGAAYVGSWLFASKDFFVWGKPRGENFLDSGSHFYEVYKTSDGKFMSVGAIEPQFYSLLLEKLGVTDDDLPHFGDWDQAKKKLADIFLTKTQEEWCSVFDGSDACVAPVLADVDAPLHPHNAARGSFLPNGQPRPAPRLSRTPPEASSGDGPEPGQHTRQILSECGYSDEQVQDLIEKKVVATVD